LQPRSFGGFNSLALPYSTVKSSTQFQSIGTAQEQRGQRINWSVSAFWLCELFLWHSLELQKAVLLW